MTDIAEIQNEINSDPIARKIFEADPGAYLANNGITLSADQLAAIKTQVQNAAAGPIKLWVGTQSE